MGLWDFAQIIADNLLFRIGQYTFQAYISPLSSQVSRERERENERSEKGMYPVLVIPLIEQGITSSVVIGIYDSLPYIHQVIYTDGYLYGVSCIWGNFTYTPLV